MRKLFQTLVRRPEINGFTLLMLCRMEIIYLHVRVWNFYFC